MMSQGYYYLYFVQRINNLSQNAPAQPLDKIFPNRQTKRKRSHRHYSENTNVGFPSPTHIPPCGRSGKPGVVHNLEP
jgi:hypothetical protein